MNGAQWNLLAYWGPTWERLWLLSDFETAKRHHIASRRSGSGPEPRTYVETDAQGIRMRRGGPSKLDPIIIAITWTAIRNWSTSVSDEARVEAERLRQLGQEIQRNYPIYKPDLGHPYAWDRPDATEAEHHADRAALDAYNAQHDDKVRDWIAQGRTHQAVVTVFLDELKPVEQVDLFGEPLDV